MSHSFLSVTWKYTQQLNHLRPEHCTIYITIPKFELNLFFQNIDISLRLKDQIEIKINQVKHTMTLSSLVLRHILSQLLNYTCLIPKVTYV